MIEPFNINIDTAEVAPSANMYEAESKDFIESIERGLAQLDTGQKISGHKMRVWAESLFLERM
jgi:hypothetical protein